MAPADFRHNGLVAIVDAGVGGVMVWGALGTYQLSIIYTLQPI